MFGDHGWNILTSAAVVEPPMVDTLRFLRLQVMIDERGIDREIVAKTAVFVLAEDIQKVRKIDE